MFERIPSPIELATFAAMALLCTLAVAISPKHDSAIFFAGVPLFFICAMIGVRRSRRRSRDADSNPTDEGGLS